MKTSPTLQHALIDCITKWRRQDPIHLNEHPPEIQTLLQQQHHIGWQQLLEGLPHKLWQKTQHNYYQRHNIRKSSKRWISSVMQQLHHLAWAQWDHRNHIKHRVKQPEYQEANMQLNSAIRKELLQGTRYLLQGDCHNVRMNLLTIMTRSLAYRKAWLINVTHARQRGMRRETGQEAGHEFSHEISSLFQWMKRRPLRPERMDE
jgi:hypothetical protein